MRDRLQEGDRRIPGAAGAVTDSVLSDHSLIPELVALLDDDDPAVVSHAAHAAMQVSSKDPALFDPHVGQLIDLLRKLKQWELGEQLPKLLTGCRLTAQQAAEVHDILTVNLESRFNIVAACSLQALVDLASDGRIDRAAGRAAIDRALVSPRKALSARARKLQKILNRLPERRSN
ncbi:MAG: hypothetical protein NXI27_01835 [Alphaproteobacteria bacterium]|nr:hypothetical protein [Alphaproteobacteria bacterium]